jgi:hypothetical protein
VQPLSATHFDSLLRSLAESPTRRGISRTLAGFALGGAVGRLSLAESEAKKRKRKKKKCKGGKKKCGKGCCGAGNACVGGICFCLESDPPADAKCRDVADILIEIIAEETGVDPGEIGANPDDPLEEHVTIEEDIRQIIDEAIEKKFGVAEEVPYYTEGITAAAAIIREEIAQKG